MRSVLEQQQHVPYTHTRTDALVLGHAHFFN